MSGTPSLLFLRRKLQVIEHCSPWSQLSPGPYLPDLLLEEDKRFRIVHYAKDCNSFVFHVMEAEAQVDNLFHLEEEILEVLEEPDLKLEETPCDGEVVLAPNPDHGNQYQRAYVERIGIPLMKIEDDSPVIVYFFDFGGYYKVKLKDLKPVTKPIMEFPILSYRVTLYTGGRAGGDDEIRFNGGGLLLCKKLQHFMEKLKKVDLLVDIKIHSTPDFNLLTPHPERLDLFSNYSVFIKYKNSERRLTFLSEELEQLKVWEWEMALNKAGQKLDDDGIFKISSFRSIERTLDAYRIDPGTEFTCQVNRVMRAEPKNWHTQLRIILLNDPLHRNYRTVLHNQMARYAKMVTKSAYNPAIKDLLMFKLDRNKGYDDLGVKFVGEWCRALLVDTDWIYLVDWDDNIPLDGVYSDHYDVRPLYGEFLQVPGLVLDICPFENGAPMLYKKAKDLFIPGQRYKFRIPESCVKDDAEYLGPGEDEGYENKIY